MHFGSSGFGKRRAMRKATRARLARLAWIVGVLFACHREPDYEGRPLADWYGLLSSTDASIRAHAAEIIAREAPDHPETLPRLLDALATESDSSVHSVLAIALADVVQRSGQSADVIPALTKLTRDSHETVRISAATALARSAAVSTDAIPASVDSAFNEMIMSNEYETRAAGVQAIGIVAQRRPDQTVRFTEAIANLTLTDRVFWVRLKALESFIAMRPPDSLAIRVYRHALQENWTDMQQLTARGLIRAPRIANALADSVVGLLRADDSETRILTIQALDSSRAAARSQLVRVELSRLTADADTSVQNSAKRALARASAQ